MWGQYLASLGHSVGAGLPECFRPHGRLKLLFAAKIFPNHALFWNGPAAILHRVSGTDDTWWPTCLHWAIAKSSDVTTGKVWPLSRTVGVLHRNPSFFLFPLIATFVATPHISKMSGSSVKKGSSGVMEWVRSACRFASDRNDFRRWVTQREIVKKEK